LALICGKFSAPAGVSFNPNATEGSGGTSVTADVNKRLRATREEECARDAECARSRETGAGAVVSLGSGRSIWFSASYEGLDRVTTSFEDGYTSNRAIASVGAEWRVKDSWLTGVAFSVGRWDGDFKSGGNFNTDSYGPIFYASFLPQAGFFADVVLNLARKDTSNTRTRGYLREDTQVFQGTVSANPRDYEFGAALSLGWDYSLRQFTIGPRFALNHTYTRFGSYSETGVGRPTGLELAYDADSKVSLQTRIGAQASSAIGRAFGVLVPQVSVDWVHEYADDQRSITVHFVQDLRDNPAKFTFQNDKPDRDFFVISAGVSVVLRNGLQVFANLWTRQGDAYLKDNAVSAGLRKEF
jgi:outer membrane autotransporter protein